MSRLVQFVAAFALTFGITATGWAQSAIDPVSSPLVGRAFSDALEEATPGPQGAEPHPTPPHTGLSALFHDTLDDFKSLPQRRSTWVILGIGGGAALLAHPADDNLNAHLEGSKTIGRLWAPGKVLGAAYTQAAVS